MNGQFTRGPWSTAGTTVYSLYFARGNERNKWDCTIYGDTDCPREELQANARLIAAAPSMYEALEAVVIALDRLSIPPAEVLDENSPIMDAIRVALKAARGEA